MCLSSLGVALTAAIVALNTPMYIEATAYCDQGYTYSGKEVREGYAAMAKEYIGKTAVVYTEDMEFIGIYEIEDTGGDHRIKEGKCIDIFNESYEWCINFGRQKVIVFLFDAEG